MYDDMFEERDIENAKFWPEPAAPFRSVAKQAAEFVLNAVVPKDWQFAAADGDTQNCKLPNILVVRGDGLVAPLEKMALAVRDMKVAGCRSKQARKSRNLKERKR